MNIVLITIAYPPEIRSISTMTRELAEELARRGHRVTVLTSWPQYNLARGVERSQFVEDTLESAVRVIRVKTLPHHKVAYPLRGVAQLLLPLFFMSALRRLVKERVNTVIVYSPHLPLAEVGTYLKRKYGARYLLNIQDIFPQNAIDLGILKNKLLIRFFEKMELRAYRAADVITTHTRGGREFLITKKGVPPGKITVVENWIDAESYSHVRATGVFRVKYGLEGKFIIIFPGILGPVQNLEFLVEIARRVRNIPKICFLLVGDGTEKSKLQRMVSLFGLSNILFKPFVSLEDYPQLVKDADMGLLCLGARNKTAAVPGKLFGFMAAALPVLAFLNQESEGHSIISEAQCGYAMIPDDVDRAAQLVRFIFGKRGQLDQLGKNGYDYVVKNFSKAACIDKLEQLL